jgi:hypothetical protein
MTGKGVAVAVGDTLVGTAVGEGCRVGEGGGVGVGGAEHATIAATSAIVAHSNKTRFTNVLLSGQNQTAGQAKVPRPCGLLRCVMALL